MPDETGTEVTRSDVPGADDSPFGDAADDKTAEAVGEQDSAQESAQDGQGPDDAETNDAKDEAAEGRESATDTGQEAGAGEDAPADDLKVVVSIKGGRATIGVQQPSSDPHIETVDDPELNGVVGEVAAVIERARARWEESPKHPAYERPAAPARRRNRRGQQGAAQGTTAETQEAETQQQTLRLF